ncbi:papain-like cysteine protease family protein [Burkholderia multivorans]|uniref:papain-like cysteine protease family protein n=1 Tax=Burkholderia multivorans TaxID=87883 RepID=UPI000D01244B|nr:papain-like cysteine protease family protein [Burkholderia multivorans]PRH49696.1 hypothetical protein C6V05_04200 [Burkholderia multivorans]
MLIQKFHQGVRLGQQTTLADSGAPLFSRQGHWDGGSTLHCVAMALALLGRLADPVYLPYHASGTERIVWDHAWPHYLHGLTLSELVSFIAELNLGVQPIVHSGEVSTLLNFTTRELHAGRPVIVGWHWQHPVTSHAALLVGVEGHQSGRTFEPHALLLLDPAGSEPGLAGFNARLDWHSGKCARYRSPAITQTVAFEGAVAIRPLVNAIAAA